MNEKTQGHLSTLYREMDKYDFKKEFTVSVSTIENDPIVVNSELQMGDRNNGELISTDLIEREARPEHIAIDETSVYFQNTNRNEKNNNDIFNSNNNLMLPVCKDKNAEINNISQTNIESSRTDFQLPHNRFSNSRSSAVHDNVSSSCNKSYAETRERRYYCDLYRLSTHLINILKTYHYFKYFLLNNCNNKPALRNSHIQNYIYRKERYFHICSDIVRRTILPQGKNFNVRDFIHKTIHTANSQVHPVCTYEEIECLYNEIIASCYKQLSSQEVTSVYHKNTNLLNNGRNVIMEKKYQNDGFLNNKQTVPQTSDTQQILDRHCDTDTVNVGHNSVQKQFSQNNWHSSNLTQNVDNRPNLEFREDLRNNEYYNIAQTICRGPNSTLQQNSINEQNTYNVSRATSNETNPILQELLLKDGYHNTYSNTPNSISEPNSKVDSQLNNVNQKISDGPNCVTAQNLEYIQNDNNNYLNQGSNVPTTCIFQYSGQNYKVRLDINNHVLNDINGSNQCNNYIHAINPDHTKDQHKSNSLKRNGESSELLNARTHQNAYQETSQILQEPLRSTSRDSGFMSPCNNQTTTDYTGEEVYNHTTPYITNVTSLNPKAVQIPPGACHVCGEITKQKCVGCFKYYYCGNNCQEQHWSRHRYTCMNMR